MQSSMWKFVKGGNPPDKKRKKDDKEEYYKEYEASKRSRTYLKEWEKGRSWLINTDDGMICSICKEFGDKNVMNQFISGCVSYKLDSVQKHQKSKGHEKAVLLYNAKHEAKSKSQAAKIIQTLNKENIEKLNIMFRNVHAMVQHNRPLNDYVWLCDLDEIKGLKLGNTYRNSKSANSFIRAIAETEFKSVASTISTSNFNCLIGDGSTDTSVKEQEMCVRSARGGEISVNFLGVKNVERANAQNIVSGIKDLLAENLLLNYNDVIKKTVALSCDGASVMVGCRSGVSALLKADQPSIITLHCMAHRLELALKDASKKLKLYDKTVSVLCMGLYYFYHNSALNRAMLYRSYDALREDDDRLLIPTKAGGTRWIGHALTCVTNLTTSYKFIVGHLGQLSEPIERVSVDSKAKGIAFLKLLKSKDVVCFLHLLMDVLEVLRQMSLILQDRTSLICEQHNIMAATLDVLKNDGPHLCKVMNQNEFQGTSLNYCNIVEFTAARKTFLSNIIEAISKRFSEFSETAVTSVISATRIANFRIWPKTWDSLKEFGDKELQVILDHFRTVLVDVGVDVEDAETEWTILKKEVLDLGLVFICHGLAEHCLYYTELAMMLAENGFYVFAHDHVGHGQSEGDRVHIDSFSIYTRDIFQHVDSVKQKFPNNKPVFIIGHSMGGAIAMLCGFERPKYFNGMILIGPALVPSPDAASPLKIMIGKVLAKVFPQMCIIKLDSKAISRDPAVVKKYEDDPLVWHNGIKAKWGLCFLEAMKKIQENQSTVDWPFLTLHGDEDKLCDVEGSKKLFEEAKSTDKDCKIYKGHYHQVHLELETDKKIVLDDIKNWLIKRS